MKYIFFLLMLIASPAWAGWTKVTETDINSEVFLDFDTIRVKGNLRRIWQLENMPPQDNTLNIKYNLPIWGSIKSRLEFDCKNKTQKTFSYIIYSKHFATGVVVQSDNKEHRKIDISPATFSGIVLQEVCKR